ncbi:hypothetical protein EWB00_000521, partial [Schistosoma japonicum]
MAPPARLEVSTVKNSQVLHPVFTSALARCGQRWCRPPSKHTVHLENYAWQGTSQSLK